MRGSRISGTRRHGAITIVHTVNEQKPCKASSRATKDDVDASICLNCRETTCRGSKECMKKHRRNQDGRKEKNMG